MVIDSLIPVLDILVMIGNLLIPQSLDLRGLVKYLLSFLVVTLQARRLELDFLVNLVLDRVHVILAL